MTDSYKRNAKSEKVKASAQGRDWVRQAAENLSDMGKETWESAKEQGEKLFDDITNEGMDHWTNTQKFIKKYPVESVGIALFAGVVFGCLMANRRD